MPFNSSVSSGQPNAELMVSARLQKAHQINSYSLVCRADEIAMYQLKQKSRYDDLIRFLKKCPASEI